MTDRNVLYSKHRGCHMIGQNDTSCMPCSLAHAHRHMSLGLSKTDVEIGKTYDEASMQGHEELGDSSALFSRAGAGGILSDFGSEGRWSRSGSE
jgi:hypothetical protein